MVKTGELQVKNTRPVLAIVLLVLAGWLILAAVASPASAQQHHTVKSGEYLSAIASKYDTSVSELVRLNSLSNPNLIFAGQRLLVASVSSAETTGSYYVKSGDTLSSIAIKLKTSISRLVELNQLKNPNLLYVGDLIKYPVRPTAAPTSFLYQVRAGDTLSKVAMKFETSVSAIKALNEIPESNAIFERDLVRVPSPPLLSIMDYWAGVYGVPADLIKALTWWESGWDNTAISTADAIGIGQLIPSTVDFVSQDLIGLSLDPHDPEDNIRMSVRFMAYLLENTNGDTDYALASYYQGLTAVRKRGVYRLTWPYVNGIQALRPRFL